MARPEGSPYIAATSVVSSNISDVAAIENRSSNPTVHPPGSYAHKPYIGSSGKVSMSLSDVRGIEGRSATAGAGVHDIRMPVDRSAGHCFPPTLPCSGSMDTYTDQFSQVRVTDCYVPHCCVHGDEEILTDRGYVKISVIHEDMQHDIKYLTLSKCPDTKQVVYSNISASYLTKRVTEYYEIELDRGYVTKLTGDHEVLLNNYKYVRTDLLRVGDEIEGIGCSISIKSIQKIMLEEDIPVYDITVANELHAQNFIVHSGIVVKNCGPVCHQPFASQGSVTTYADMLAKHCSTHAMSCGDFAANGSMDTNSGY